MQYLISFLEGIITFISPCLLPMLPIYVSYFAGGGERTSARTLKNALGFVLGFTVIFVAMGALAGTVGSFLRQYRTWVDLVSGLIVIFFGLNFLGVFKCNLFRGTAQFQKTGNMGFFSALLFGVIFSVGWTPCVGAFLGSALMLASQQGHVLEGMLMLLAFSLGLGIPFVISAVLMMCAAKNLLEMMFNAVTNGSSMFYDRYLKTHVVYNNSRKNSLFGIRVIDMLPLIPENIDVLSREICDALIAAGIQKESVTKVRLMAEGVLLDWIESGLEGICCELRMDRRFKRTALMVSVPMRWIRSTACSAATAPAR